MFEPHPHVPQQEVHSTRRQEKLKAHQEFLSFCLDYVSGKYGLIDQFEFEIAEKAIAETTEKIDSLLIEKTVL